MVIIFALGDQDFSVLFDHTHAHDFKAVLRLLTHSGTRKHLPLSSKKAASLTRAKGIARRQKAF
jgi:hypothetical protein